MDRDICERLEEIIALKFGDELPAHMIDPTTGRWDNHIRSLLRDAKTEIEALRAVSGLARGTSGFKEIRQEVKNGASV